VKERKKRNWMREEGKMWSERKKEKKCGKREKKMRENERRRKDVE